MWSSFTPRMYGVGRKTTTQPSTLDRDDTHDRSISVLWLHTGQYNQRPILHCITMNIRLRLLHALTRLASIVARPFSSRHVLIIRRILWLVLTVPVNCFSSLCELAELLIECKKFSTVTVLLSCVLKPAGHCFGLGLDFTDAVLVPLLIYVRSYCKCQKQHLWTRRLFTHNTSDRPTEMSTHIQSKSTCHLVLCLQHNVLYWNVKIQNNQKQHLLT